MKIIQIIILGLICNVILSQNPDDSELGLEIQDNTDDFFHDFENLPGNTHEDEMFDYFNFEEYNMMVDVKTKEIVRNIQTDWFTKHGVNPVELLNRVDYGTVVPHQESTLGSTTSTIEGDLNVWATKADEWCFMRLNHKTIFEVSFFFNCADQLELGNDKILLRKMDDNCPLPVVKPPTPPTAEICYLYQKRGKNIVSHIFESYGEVNAKKVLECYVTVTETVVKPDIETMCATESVGAEWNKITKQDIEELKKSSTNFTVGDDGITRYDLNDDTSRTDRIDARVISEGKPAVLPVRTRAAVENNKS